MAILDNIDKSSWLKVFSACLGKMIVIQNNANKYVVKGRDWGVNFSEGWIAFGDDLYPVQFIGSEATSSNTWMWGWNNINNFPEEQIRLPMEILKKGEDWNLRPLKEKEFDLTDMFNGHNLAIVACGISEDNYFYYRGPHDGGAILMGIGNVPEEVYEPVPLSEFAALTMQCIRQYPLDQKIFIESFLEWNKTGYDWNGDTVTAHFDQDLHIRFEDMDGRYVITEIKN